jgi:hypothetical protein
MGCSHGGAHSALGPQVEFFQGCLIFHHYNYNGYHQMGKSNSLCNLEGKDNVLNIGSRQFIQCNECFVVMLLFTYQFNEYWPVIEYEWSTISYLSCRKDFLKMAVFWVVALCSLVEVYQRFRDPCCQAATTQKTAIFVLTAVRTSNPTQDFLVYSNYEYEYWKTEYLTRWDFRFSRRRVWRWLSSGMLRRVDW